MQRRRLPQSRAKGRKMLGARRRYLKRFVSDVESQTDHTLGNRCFIEKCNKPCIRQSTFCRVHSIEESKS